MDIEKLVEGLERFSLHLGSPLTSSRKKLKRRYSITGDIISYSICPRQYGFYKFLGYAPSNPTQEWYGSIIHRFLKRAHLYFLKNGEVPDEKVIEEIFHRIESAMEAEGVRASSEKARESALSVLKKFCRIEGKNFFSSVLEAELQLIKELDNFILYGIVDVLKRDGEALEIWDYKGMRRPDERKPFGREKLERYRKQMFVYGYLFKERSGEFPKRAVLYFMNELLNCEKRPESAIYVVDFEKEETVREVKEFISEFKRIVERIEKSRETNSWELPAEIDEETCKQCDFRFDCPKVL
ncbi:PD-(D/E)XK nuclease family protein [Phorcysia thermohydrogeniphila]|uniref:Putative RecB family exonuclease n=1 Tax=Phorcysia thermohydrogeniphila TaxID=936138 RepID=A0A4R1GCQ1_9BACT|nr:PD-(D/E)XK nuclease family protein [Phorcysia thermohydrogeniphila]TCK04583.1 putative RecB family exonuclease [Phorcysia thermohydrogeniphila]